MLIIEDDAGYGAERGNDEIEFRIVKEERRKLE